MLAICRARSKQVLVFLPLILFSLIHLRKLRHREAKSTCPKGWSPDLILVYWTLPSKLFSPLARLQRDKKMKSYTVL